LIDDEDFDRVNQFKWYASKTGDSGTFYARHCNGTGTRSPIYMHRFIMDCPPDKEIDHIDRTTLDNRRENLRVVSKQENMKNRKYKRDQ